MSIGIALAVGDPNGIGPEIALRALAALAADPTLEFTLFGPRAVIEHYADRLGCAAQVARARVHDCGGFDLKNLAPGRIDERAGRATVAAARAAIDFVRGGNAQVVVACPHHETAVNRAGIAFSGYPGLLAETLGLPPDRVFLMLTGAGLNIVHATLHEGIRSALGRLTPALFVDAAQAGARALRARGVPSPRIAVFGINPHGGEDGLFGDDDERITKPAVASLRELGLRVDGPAGADTLLMRREHDLYVAAYHDQGHIPIKLAAGTRSSALSIGAGVLLASVGHGSAMDIAGRLAADPSALIDTILRVAGRPHPVAAIETDPGKA